MGSDRRGDEALTAWSVSAKPLKDGVREEGVRVHDAFWSHSFEGLSKPTHTSSHNRQG